MEPIHIQPKPLLVKQSYYSTHALPLPSPIIEICLKNHFQPRWFVFGSAAQRNSLEKIENLLRWLVEKIFAYRYFFEFSLN